MVNNLLLRLVKKHLGNPEKLDDKLKTFLEAVDRSYEHCEEERLILTRSMELSSDELFRANEKLRYEAEKHKVILDKLKDTLWNLQRDKTKFGKNKLEDQDVVSIVDSLKQQILQKKRAESALKESEEKFRLITSSAKDAIIMIDDNGNVSYWNDSAEKILGFSAAEIIGKNFLAFIVPVNYKAKYQEGFEHFKLTGESEALGKVLNLEAIRKNGEKIPVELSISAVKIKNRWHAIGIIRDVSERLNNDRELKKLLNELEEANKEFKNLTYIAAHDLKTPLRGIATLVNWLQTDYQDKFDETGIENLKLLTERVQRMYNLIDSILLYLKAIGNNFKKDNIDLQYLLENLVNEIPHSEEIKIVLEKDFPMIYFDKRFIYQVWQNLIINAVEHTNKKNGLVKIGFTEYHDFYEFYISDNGKGIRERYQKQIFKLFRSLSEKVDKVGLGLPLTKKIIENNGGKIWLKSKQNEGATFYFTVPKI